MTMTSKVASVTTAATTEYDFSLVLSATAAFSQTQENALFEAGCDDATIGLRNGHIYLTFTRAGSSMFEAILDAMRDVRRANLGVEVLRVDYCNLVTIADIARKMGRTRQCVHQYALGTRGPGGFPPPACETSDGNLLYYWCEVATWLYDNDLIAKELLNEAQQVGLINNVLEFHRKKQQHSQLTAQVEELCESFG
jgi:hypothetical protein